MLRVAGLGAALVLVVIWTFVGCAGAPVGRQKPHRAATLQPTADTAATAAVNPQVHEPQGGQSDRPPTPPLVITAEQAEAAHRYARSRVLTAADAELAAAQAKIFEAEGVAVELEQPSSGDALAGFRRALTRLRESSGAVSKVRIAVFGASGTAQDLWTAYLRAYFQQLFGDGGPGFVAAAPTTRWSRHNELEIRAVPTKGAFAAANPQRGRLAESNAYGLGLQLVRALGDVQSHTQSTLAPRSGGPDPRLARFEVWSWAWPLGGALRIELDGAPGMEFSTQAQLPVARYDVLDVEPGPHTLSLIPHGRGESRLFGVVAESDLPGVVLDNLGFDGARASAHLDNDELTWREQMQRRAYDLYVLAYGTNEAFHDPREPLDGAALTATFAAVLDRFERAAPNASCVVMLPPLHDAVAPGKFAPVERAAVAREVMRNVALARDCAVFDGAAVRGPGGIRAWVEAGLARRDYVHLTPRGHAQLGMTVADALTGALVDAPATSAP